MKHTPVLLNETIAALDPKPGKNFIDCTFGWGGHTAKLLEKNAPDGIVIGLEIDRQSLQDFVKTDPELASSDRLILINESYTKIKRIAKEQKIAKVDGILFDLGLSSWHIDESKKGFAFSKDEPLDMRFGQDGFTAAQIVNSYPREELENIFKNFGQEKMATKLAQEIAEVRNWKQIVTTQQLVQIIGRVAGHYPPKLKTKIFATVFQALRMAVNSELENIEKGIEEGFEILEPDGRMAMITFHSLEDRIVKQKFADLVKIGKASHIFKKPVTPAADEIKSNPRARSAKLRAIVKN